MANLKNLVTQTCAAASNSLTVNMDGTITGRQSFSGAGFVTGDRPFYFGVAGSVIEWGIGTFTTGSPDTLARTTVLGGTAGAGVRSTFSGTTTFYSEVPAEYAVFIDHNGIADLRTNQLDGVTAINRGAVGGQRNIVDNGRMSVWQRGTSFSTPASNSFTADLWRLIYGGTSGTFSVSRQAATDATLLDNGLRYFLRYDRTVAGSGSSAPTFQQAIYNARTYSARNVRVSFLAKTDSTRNVTISLVQVFGTGGSPSSSVTVSASAVAVGSSWTVVEKTIALASVAGNTFGSNNDDYLALNIALPADVVMTIDITGVQITPGTTTESLEWEADVVTQERCQRRYLTGTVKWAGTVTSGHTVRITDALPVPMFTTPTVAVSASSMSGLGAASISALDSGHVAIEAVASGTGQASFEVSYTAVAG